MLNQWYCVNSLEARVWLRQSGLECRLFSGAKQSKLFWHIFCYEHWIFCWIGPLELLKVYPLLTNLENASNNVDSRQTFLNVEDSRLFRNWIFSVDLLKVNNICSNSFKRLPLSYPGAAGWDFGAGIFFMMHSETMHDTDNALQKLYCAGKLTSRIWSLRCITEHLQ